MKVLFVLPLMTGIGGIQASLVNLIRALPRKDYDVSVCVLGNWVAPSNPLPAGVDVIRGPRILEYCLSDFRSLIRRSPRRALAVFLVKVLQRMIGFRRILRLVVNHVKVRGVYDVAIAYANDIYVEGKFAGGSNEVVDSCVNAALKVAWIHNDSRRHGLTRDICMRTYRNFDSVVNVSYCCKTIFDDIIPEYRQKSHVVYNVIDTKRVAERASNGSPYKTGVSHFVTVARLDNRQKRIDRIIDACVLLKSRGIDGFCWHIVGDGPDGNALKAQARSAEVDDVLLFEGQKANPFPYMKHADALVISSDYEANSMVLREAMSLGTPPIVTRYEAASEIVEHGVNGLMTDLTAESLGSCLESVLRDSNILATIRFRLMSSPIDNADALLQFAEVVGAGQQRTTDCDVAEVGSEATSE